MSDYENRVGSIKQTNLTVENVINEWLKHNQKPSYYNLPEDNVELFRDEIENYVEVDGLIYEIVDDRDYGDMDIFELNEGSNSNLDYTLRYYNGGCGYKEALERAISKFNKIKGKNENFSE